MSKGVKRVLGAVAAIAVPFVAPALAGVMGISSTLGQAAVGAGLGAAASAATGGNPLLGALTGGVGTFALGGGFGQMFGAARTLPGQQSVGGGLFGGPGMTTGTPLYAQSGATGAGLLPPTGAAAPAAMTAAAPTGIGGFFQQVGQGLLANPSGIAQLAMTVFGRPPQELTAAEQANLEELRGLADTNRELFEQRVRVANETLQMAAQQAPNPQQAFAETKIATERQLAEGTRGMGADEAAFARRRAGIRSTQTGATAAAAEEARGRQTQSQLTQAGYSMLPSSAPRGYAGLALPTYEALQQRRYAFGRDLSRAAGDMFGSIA